DGVADGRRREKVVEGNPGLERREHRRPAEQADRQMTDVADREGQDEQGEARGGDSDSHFRQVEIVEEEEEAQRREGQADEHFEQRSHPARLYGMSRPRARSMSSTEPMTGPTTGGRRGHATEDVVPR